jgi:large subunit ribosomal protein L25
MIGTVENNDLVVLKAEKRDALGTGASRALRRRGMVPVTLYGNGLPAISLSIIQKEITKYYRKPQYISQIFLIELDGGESYKVLPKAISLDPITELVIHADFVFLASDVQVMQMPLVYSNKENCIGVKRGGYFNTVRRSLKVACPINSMFRKLELDTTSIPIGKSILAKDIELPEGVNLLDNPNTVIASIIGKKGKASAEEDKTA